MELLAIDSMLTIVTDPCLCGLRAWLDPALVACQRARDEASPFALALPQELQTAGWRVTASSDTQVPLPQVVGLLRADPRLAVLLDRRGGISLPDEAQPVLDAWWQRSLAAMHPAAHADSSAEPSAAPPSTPDPTERMLMLVATLGIGRDREPLAQLYALALPAPSWRWLTRLQIQHARLQQHALRLDEDRYAGQARALAERARPLLAHAQAVHLSTAQRALRDAGPTTSHGGPPSE
jgi:hypothetical protein